MTGYPRRASLAGRCGIPTERERIYVQVDMAGESIPPSSTENPTMGRPERRFTALARALKDRATVAVP